MKSNVQLVEELCATRHLTLHEALARIDAGGRGLVLLVDQEGRFERTVTDGDLRRLILAGAALQDRLERLPEINSIWVKVGASRRQILELMNANSVNHIPVVDDDLRPVDVIDRRSVDDPILLSTPHMGSAERDFVEEAFRTNWIAPLGPNVDAFERELADLVGVRHAAAVSSGTAAIHLALRLLDVGPGDRVFCSTLTFAASANPIVYQGAQPVFIDSELGSWNMCPAALARALDAARAENQLPKAVIVVNLYGQSADLDAILDLCARDGVAVVEDAAESLGAQYKGRASGTLGRMGIYSFNGNKIITTSGGGMLVADDAELVDRARFLATQARDPAPHYQHSEIGYNYRMSNILAGVGRGQLAVLQDRVNSRRAVFEAYREGMSGLPIEWMPEPDWSYSTRWLSACTLREDAKASVAELIAHFRDELIEVRPVWKPMHLQPVFADAPFFTAANRPVADELFERGICLPSGSNLTDEQIDRTIDAMRRFF